MRQGLKSRMLRVVLDAKCDADATRAAILRLRDVKHAELFIDVDLSASMEPLGLAKRTRNALLGAKITTLGQLTARSRYELRRVKGLGKHGLREIEDRLKYIGLALRPQTSGEYAHAAKEKNSGTLRAEFLLDFEETRAALRRLWMTAAQKGYVSKDWIDWKLVDRALRSYAHRAAAAADVSIRGNDLPPSDPEPLVLPALPPRMST
jgi:Bacterial RNA polymerase, alpha chain C terminal domain